MRNPECCFNCESEIHILCRQIPTDTDTHCWLFHKRFPLSFENWLLVFSIKYYKFIINVLLLYCYYYFLLNRSLNRLSCPGPLNVIQDFSAIGWCGWQVAIVVKFLWKWLRLYPEKYIGAVKIYIFQTSSESERKL